MLGSIFCNQAAISMRVGARLARTKLTLLSRGSTTSRTTDSEYLFCAEGFLDGSERMLQRPSAGMVNFE